ncbi:protein CHROMATIN REMODELING 20-like isoform X1 [Zingiber officinale]|uniref:protein CHROMATIN REMODELING 20-like isoform X1 n=2 Tax=Zingiber officinale TaxID=94328 RepID=UPI001C4ACA4B|nr:protein CHROMATIN REMODELING 20-like isoform X1 [Zingiber officinale]XP_042422293.1 protein CHROMATIN REMODELING 20-like isoform X1 [Zingiber officinale]XP_042422295.1 protein CHROMATIN REMODELING 20-like isoform X1 [Zingiber officinale]XP_042422296.1 protein CHROMATIN REMODELING 20-like isoform X1 [Zingiber officinale]XP_042422297.1 protein CHROMATIN REMODELING 20-like isoform X1 [Zingiber officinale]
MDDLIEKETELRKVEVIIIEENDPEDIINEHEEKAKDDNIHQGEKGKGGLDAVKHGKDDNSIESKVHIEPEADVIAEDYSDEDDENVSFEMLLDGSDNEITSASDNDCEPKSEAPLTDAEIEELIAEFLEVESKAAEAQESLEHESLANVESEVRAELAENLHGDELELAVSKEMKVLVEMWTDTLDNLETQSAILLEQLDGAGIELPSLYKYIESQVPDCCRTEAWRKRAHWVGTQAPAELNQSIRDAEHYLQSHQPVRRKHGRVYEIGSGGYLAKNLSVKDSDNFREYSEQDWHTFDEIIHSNQWSDINSLSNNWAAVYLASTPQQAANLGLNLPGVNEVEEIGEIEGNPLYAEAIQNEKEIGFSEEQKRNYRKVREEDDMKVSKKLQLRLKQKRKRKEHIQNDILDGTANTGEFQSDFIDQISPCPFAGHTTNTAQDLKLENSMDEKLILHGIIKKRLLESVDADGHDSKRCRAVVIESDDEVINVVKDKVAVQDLPMHLSPSERVREVDVIDVDVLCSPTSANYCSGSNVPLTFHCTACSEVLKASEVQGHPLIEVIICGNCKLLVEDKMKTKDPDDFCRWCGKPDDLIGCNSCKMLFCAMCISRNFGETRLLEVKANGWDCCCCLPMLLEPFILEFKKAVKGFSVSSSESEFELPDGEMDVRLGHKKRRKRRIRRIMDDAELGEETKRKIAMEKARQDHLKSMQASSFSKLSTIRSSNESATEGIMTDATEGFIINVARETDEEPVRIPQSICAKLKPHQISGIRFMWENIIQSVRKVKSGDKGLGCILAHTMGLGKTFQVIAFLYTALRKADLGLRTALVVTPVNVLHNWRREFAKWQPTELKPLRVFMLEDVARERRLDLLLKWRMKGGVFLVGYAAFRNLSLGRHAKDRNTASEISHALRLVPDILVCDEAHMIKNTKADITQALKSVKTQRRIALTGSPLQNNLMEYYCMVDFVREGFLGSSQEFRNRFQNPIENGQHTNSTMNDVRTMNQRSHILYEQLKGFVQRVDMNVVKKDLPAKTVFVITVKLSPLQRKLYKKFLEVHGFTRESISSEKMIRKRCFFAGYQALAQIWNHPGLLQMAKEHKNFSRKEDAVENFLVEDSSSDDNMESVFMNGDKQRSKDDLPCKGNDNIFVPQEIGWWEDLIDDKIYQEVDYSGKMVLLLDILTMSSEIGDKVLIFSQSLTTLDLIEMYLSKLPRKGCEGKFWKQGKDWYRLDGSTQPSERQKLVEIFNEPSNRRVKCTLISTRAGSLGINLHSANRVILVDGSWNPTYDLQAIYRVWRYGQNKPVYAYRLMAHGTMEEKIYKRQVTKEGLAARVVDRQQVHRTMSKEEMLHLFDFGDDENVDVTEPADISLVNSDYERTNGIGCSRNSLVNTDNLMDRLLRRHHPRWISNYHEHETLLQENEAERLTKEEQDMAWQIYQRSLEWEEVSRAEIDDTRRVLNKNSLRENTVPQSVPQLAKSSSRSRLTNQRKCTNLAHLLTLRCQGIKSGSSTICKECSQEISWENLNRDGRSR